MRRSVSLRGKSSGMGAWLVSAAAPTNGSSSVAAEARAPAAYVWGLRGRCRLVGTSLVPMDEPTLGSGRAVDTPAHTLSSGGKKSACRESTLACSALVGGMPPPGGSGTLRFGFRSEPTPVCLFRLRDFCRTLAPAAAGIVALRSPRSTRFANLLSKRQMRRAYALFLRTIVEGGPLLS